LELRTGVGREVFESKTCVYRTIKAVSRIVETNDNREIDEFSGSEYKNEIGIIASPKSKLPNNDVRIVILEQGHHFPLDLMVQFLVFLKKHI
jgi:hypothetical protein